MTNGYESSFISNPLGLSDFNSNKHGALDSTPITSKASQDTIESMNSTNLHDIKGETIKDIISDSNNDNGVNITSRDTSDDVSIGKTWIIKWQYN